jgi:hypothetical protein
MLPNIRGTLAMTARAAWRALLHYSRTGRRPFLGKLRAFDRSRTDRAHSEKGTKNPQPARRPYQFDVLWRRSHGSAQRKVEGNDRASDGYCRRSHDTSLAQRRTSSAPWHHLVLTGADPFRPRFRKKCRSESTGPQKWPSVTGQIPV